MNCGTALQQIEWTTGLTRASCCYRSRLTSARLERSIDTMALTSRGHALQRLGALRAKRLLDSGSDSPDRLKAYYERNASKNASGRLSRKHLDAFVGVCTSCSSSGPQPLAESEIIEALDLIVSCWPEQQANSDSEIFPSAELKCVAQEAFAALFRLKGNDLGLSKIVLDKFSQLTTSAETTKAGMVIEQRR